MCNNGDILGCPGKFVPMLKENWNAENFNLINVY